MTVAELIEKLKDYDQEALVLVNNVTVDDISAIDIVMLGRYDVKPATSEEIANGETVSAVVLS